MPSIFLRACWRYLLMVNYEIHPDILLPFLPKGTELDFYQGRTFVSMVGFRFLETQVLGFKVPFHQNFEEVNLRFYVKRKTQDGWKRGVVFIREIVPKFPIAFIARTFYNEPYMALPMRSEIRLPVDHKMGTISYQWKINGKWQSLSATFSGEPTQTEPDSEPNFIMEHYWGYTAQSDGGTLEYQVEHPSWSYWSAESPIFQCDIAALYGEKFQSVLSAEPTSAFVAEGSEVSVRKGLRVV